MVRSLCRLVEITDMEIVEINQEIAKKAALIRAEYKGLKANGCLTACNSVFVWM